MKKLGQGFFGDFKATPAPRAAPAPAAAPTGGNGFFSGPMQAPAPSAAPNAQPGQAARPAPSGPIQKMQRDLILLYQTIKSKPEVAQWFSRDQESKPGNPEFTKGPDAFLQFMLNRYVGKAQQQGAQFNMAMPNAKDYAAPGKQLPKESFLQYLEMLRVVGPHSTKDQVRTPDNNWDVYTDNAIRAAWSIAFAMTTLSNKLGERFSFTEADLDKLRSLIPDSPEDLKDLTPEQKVKRAEEITPYIVKLRKSINDFIALMTDASHKYSQYISENKTFDVLKNEQASGLNGNDQMKAKQLMQGGAPIPNVYIPADLSGESDDKFPITFNDISNVNNFIKYLNDNQIKIRGMDASKGDGIRVAANYLKRQISLAMNKIKQPGQDGF